MKRTVYFVTSNTAKIEEVMAYLKVHACPFLELRHESLDIEEIQTLDQQSLTRDKARKAWAALKKPILIDDGAIYFARYNNFPGPLAKFVAQGLGFEGLKRIIEDGDRATRVLYLAYCDGGEPVLFEGRSEGTLVIPDEIGDPRFPYNSFFIPDGAEQTNEHMRGLIAQHGKEFYRIKALQKFLAWFQDQP
jgi:non-canonical purine NTP pyrophosphatase (RdgB/HAM1 family)